MDYLPINLRLRHKRVVLVGAGIVAARKARFLLAADAQLTVIAPERDKQFEALFSDDSDAANTDGGSCDWLQRGYQRGDLEGAVLVIAATPDTNVNQAVYAEASTLNIPVNVVDCPELCSFIFPAIVDRSPVTIAIGSSGASPVLARWIRSRIESILPAGIAEIARFGQRNRERIRAYGNEERDRRQLWEQIVDGPIAQLLLANRAADADVALGELLEERPVERVGEVYLIGAGPGDPELMTFKALRLLQRADVVLHDRLVNPQIVAMARRDAQRRYVGKQRSIHAVPQEVINQTLVDLAKDGKTVARLKGGDPFIFGRGGEEIELLAREGINFQVVPGITAASAAACYAGIPLTHRDHAQSVRFVTGHTKEGRLQHPWSEFLNEAETLVFYMGLVGLPIICEELLRHGRSPDTPMALIERATLPQQRTLKGTLSSMPEQVAALKPEPPTLIIIGNVVALADTLRWFGDGVENVASSIDVARGG